MNFRNMSESRRCAMAQVAAWARWSKRPADFKEARLMIKVRAIAQGAPLNAVAIARNAKALLEASRCH